MRKYMPNTLQLLQKSIIASLGGALATAILLLISDQSGHAWIMAPFGASCVILFALPESPLARAKNVIIGHTLTALTGLIALHYLPMSTLTIALAVGLGIGLMLLSKTTHPPAGANPLLILFSGKTFGWDFLIFPVLLGAVALVLIAHIYHRLMNYMQQQTAPPPNH